MPNILITWIQGFFKSLGTTLDARTVALVTPALAALATDLPMLQLLGTVFAVVLAVAAFSHLVLKVYFPYIDRQVLVDAAKTDPKAAALIFMSTCMVLCVLIFTISTWVRLYGQGG